MTKSEEILEEYKALRAEILMQIDHHRREYLILLPIIGAILTYAITNNQPLFCLLAFFINLYAWRHHRDIWSAMIKLGAYIEVFIEPETDGLQYESIMSKIAPKRDYSKPSLDRLFDKIIPTPYAIISFVSSSSGLYLVYEIKTLEWYFYYLLIAVAAVVIIIHLAIIIHYINRKTIGEKEYWKNLLREVKEEEEEAQAEI